MPGKMTLWERTSKAGKAGGPARAAALSPARRREIALLGASLGGQRRAETLSARRRREIARQAALARWGKRKEG